MVHAIGAFVCVAMLTLASMFILVIHKRECQEAFNPHPVTWREKAVDVICMPVNGWDFDAWGK